MNKDEILAKSRAENKNQDVYALEVLKKASKNAVVVQMALAAVFFVAQLLVGEGNNWGLWAIVYSGNMTVCWVKYRELRRSRELMLAVAYTLLVVVMAGYHLYQLLAASVLR